MQEFLTFQTFITPALLTVLYYIDALPILICIMYYDISPTVNFNNVVNLTFYIGKYY